jgi:hypothetical protein
MPLNRLRRILQAQYVVRVESTDALVAEVVQKVDTRRQEFIDKGKAPPPVKQPKVFQPLAGARVWNIRPIDLLHKIGGLTTPRNTNYAKLSASWATRRYLWAIAEQNGTRELRLSADARELDFHQKTLLSDEFGIGMAGLLAETYLGTSEFVDVSIALEEPQAYQGIYQVGTAQPDFCMWSETDRAAPLYVVECKGSQTTRSTSISQLRRGLEQVPSVAFINGGRRTLSLVIATFLDQDNTLVFVLDPPNEDDREIPPGDKRRGPSEKVGERLWRITDAEAFQKRIWNAHESYLLKWAGQFHDAAAIDEALTPERIRRAIAPNAELSQERTEIGTFTGMSVPLFPELGNARARIFRGVEEELLVSVRGRLERARELASAIKERVSRLYEHPADRLSPTTAFGRSGTCTIVENLLA